MMQLSEECIVLELKSTTKEELLAELALVVQKRCPAIALSTITQVLHEREQMGSTGVGNGVAIPHGKLAELNQLLLCFGKSSRGIGYDAKDKQPVHLVVMILSPLDMAEEYLLTLGKVSRLLKEEKNRTQLLCAGNPQAIQQIFAQTA